MNSEMFLQWLSFANAPCQKPYAYQRPPLIMGILNVTPDSFYDGGTYVQLNDAYQYAMEMTDAGADIIDIGGESSRPGAVPVSLDEELSRVIPVIERIRDVSDVCISIDTSKPEVMKQAVAAGATFINDVNALKSDGALMVAAKLDVPVCLMHMQGDPQSMQLSPYYADDVVSEINVFFQQRIDACLHAGIARERLLLDPGFGFGKSVHHNLTLVKRLAELSCHQLPLLIGVSRKSTIGSVLQSPLVERLSGGLALTILSVLNGATIVRTHDVKETKQALQMLDAILNCDNYKQ